MPSGPEARSARLRSIRRVALLGNVSFYSHFILSCDMHTTPYIFSVFPYVVYILPLNKFAIISLAVIRAVV